MTEIILDDYQGCVDVPDSRDITAEDLGLLSSSDYPESLLHANTPILNQGNVGACTVFGLSWATFESTYLDAIENGSTYKQPFDPWEIWEKAKERGASDNGGWSLQWALQLALDLWLISGYVKLAGPWDLWLETIAKAISKNRLIYTWSGKGNWKAIKKTAIFEKGIKFSGHAYCITGYDSANAIARNSWTENWGNKWHFFHPENTLEALYSSYIILDPSDAEKMRDLKNSRAKIYNEKSLAKNIWNGQRATDTATEEEIRIMVARAANILWGRSRKFWASLFEENILRGKGIVSIWNEKDGNKIATDKEVAIMFTRAVKRSTNVSTMSLSRFQVSAVIWRDFL